MQGRLWEYSGFFFSGSFLSHSSSCAAETSASSGILEKTRVVVVLLLFLRPGAEEDRGWGQEGNLEKSEGRRAEDGEMEGGEREMANIVFG